MIKPGKVCSQLMKENNTGETNIKVVRKYFRLTFVFNAIKTSVNLYLNSFIALSLFLIFEIKGVLSFKTCLEGGNLIKLTMHAPWCITGCSSNIFHQSHMQRTSLGGSKALFCRKIMEACETKEHRHDSKQRNQVEWPIMQAKECMREFGRCKHAATKVTKQRWVCWKKTGARRGKKPPRPAGPGRPASPLFKHPGALLRQVSCSSSTLFMCSSL
jgi:hypothetical protein